MFILLIIYINRKYHGLKMLFLKFAIRCRVMLYLVIIYRKIIGSNPTFHLLLLMTSHLFNINRTFNAKTTINIFVPHPPPFLPCQYKAYSFSEHQQILTNHLSPSYRFLSSHWPFLFHVTIS